MTLVEADVVIDAPVEDVWRAMVDLDNYPQWNPFIERVERPADREPRIGDLLTLHVRFKNGRTALSRERISRLEPPTVLEYGYTGWLHNTGLIRGSRIQRLSPTGDGGTLYHTEERLRGPLTALIDRAVADGFRRHAAALKTYVENR